MKKLLLPLLPLFIVCFVANAQDRIYLKNGKTVEAKIIEVGKLDVLFKKTNNTDGPSYRELKSGIDKIVYANGEIDLFSEMPAPVVISPKNEIKQLPETNTIAFKKHTVYYSISDVLFKRISIAYEYIFSKGFLGVKVPFSYGIGSNQVMDVDYLNSVNNQNDPYYYSNLYEYKFNEFNSITRKFTAGIELNAYPFGQRPVSFYVGPAFYYGLLNYDYQEVNYSNYYLNNVTKSASGRSYAGMINAGLAIHTNSNFSVNFQIGMGFRKNKVAFESNSTTLISPAFLLGYKF